MDGGEIPSCFPEVPFPSKDVSDRECSDPKTGKPGDDACRELPDEDTYTLSPPDIVELDHENETVTTPKCPF